MYETFFMSIVDNSSVKMGFNCVIMLLQFRPLEQLMGVFPAASSSHVPAPWASLMSDPVCITK
jgi:5'-3' exonuclease